MQRSSLSLSLYISLRHTIHSTHLSSCLRGCSPATETSNWDNPLQSASHRDSKKHARNTFARLSSSQPSRANGPGSAGTITNTERPKQKKYLRTCIEGFAIDRLILVWCRQGTLPTINNNQSHCLLCSRSFPRLPKSETPASEGSSIVVSAWRWC